MSAIEPVKLKLELDFTDAELVDGLRALIREEIDADRVRRSGLTGVEAEKYAAAIRTDFRGPRHG